MLHSYEAGTDGSIEGHSLKAGTYTLEIAPAKAGIIGDFSVTVMRDADVTDVLVVPAGPLGTAQASWNFTRMANLSYVISHWESSDMTTQRSITPQGSSGTLIGLKQETSYTVNLSARWTCGNQEFSRFLDQGTTALFPAPSGFAVEDTANAGELNAGWATPSVVFDATIDSYEMQYRLLEEDVDGSVVEGDWEPSTPLAPTGASHLVQYLFYGLYEFRLRAKYVDSDSNVTYSAYVEAMGYPVSKGAPSALQATFSGSGSSRSAAVAWSHPARALTRPMTSPSPKTGPAPTECSAPGAP